MDIFNTVDANELHCMQAVRQHIQLSCNKEDRQKVNVTMIAWQVNIGTKTRPRSNTYLFAWGMKAHLQQHNVFYIFVALTVSIQIKLAKTKNLFINA